MLCIRAALSAGGQAGSAAVTVAATRPNRMAPRAAKPTTMPVKRIVPPTPEPMPARSGGMALMLTLAVSPLRMPAPVPASNMPPSRVPN